MDTISSSATARSAARSRPPRRCAGRRTGGERHDPRVLGRPVRGRHDPARSGRAPTSSSRPRAATRSSANVAAALEAGVRRFVIATTGWAADRAARRARCCATTAPRPSRPPTSASASRCSGGSSRRRSRCSGRSTTSTRTSSSGIGGRSATGRRAPRTDLAGADRRRPPAPGRPRTTSRSSRSGPASSPGMHLVGFDAAGETVELRLTARDRSAYAAGILAAADWLAPRAARARPPRLRPRRRRAHRSPPHRCLKGPTDDPAPATTRTTRPTIPATRPHAARRVHRPRHAVHGRRRPRRGRLPPARPLAGPGRHRRPRPVRHDRRVPHPVARRARVAHRHDRRGRRASARRATGSASSPGPARTTPPPRSRRPAGPPSSAPMRRSSSRPYYNRPDGRMLEAHFRAVADEGDLPIVVYNVPSRTGANVDADTFLRLAEHPRIVAVKEASGNLEQIARICRDRPRDVAVLAGDDAWTLPILAMGGDGVVSVASNEIPGELVALCAAAHAGDWDGGPAHPRALAAAVPGQLPGRPEPGAGQGRARPDGPARRRTWCARRSCRSRQRAARRWPRRCAGSGWSRRPAAGSRPPDGAPDGARRPSHDALMTDRHGSRPPSAAIDPATVLADLEAGRLRAAEPDPTAPDGWRVRPDVKAAILACFADRTTIDWAAGPLRSATGPAVPPRDDLHGGPWRIVPGGTAVRRGAHLGDGVVVMPPSYVNVGAWVGAGDDGRLARAGRVVRPDRGAGPPRGGRDHRRRARAARRPPGHRRGRRVRRGRLRPARWRPRRARRRHRRRGHADRDVARSTTSFARRVLQGHGRRAAGRAAGRRGHPRGARPSPAAFAADHGLAVSRRAPGQGPRCRDGSRGSPSKAPSDEPRDRASPAPRTAAGTQRDPAREPARRASRRTSWPTRFGTPLYVYDLDVIERQVTALTGVLPPVVDLAYAVKANPALAVVAAPRPARASARTSRRPASSPWPAGPGSTPAGSS